MDSKKIIVLIFLFPILLFGQQVNFLEIYKNLELFKVEKTNSNNVRELVNNILLKEIESGYFTCNVDSVNLKNQRLKIYLQTGNLISVNSIEVNLPNSLDLKLREDFNSEKTYFNANDFSKRIKKWIILMNNNGFPFAEFEFQKSEIINSKLI